MRRGWRTLGAIVVALAWTAAAAAGAGPPAVPLPAAPAPGGAEPAPPARAVVGPFPDWVLEAPIPPAPREAGDSAVALLMTDQQIRLEDGGQAWFMRTVTRVNASEGLRSGSLALSWDPAFETALVHRFRIWRDGRVIDLLGDGSAMTVVRREPRLEQAMLDGRVTATLQPEDVRVGDILESAITIRRRDPAFQGRMEILAGLPDGTPIGFGRVRLLWPREAVLRHRLLPGTPSVRARSLGAFRELVVSVSDETTPSPPQGAPMRFQLINAVEASNARDWEEVSAHWHALYRQASRLQPGSPVAQEATAIREAHATDAARALAALRLVQDNVRYLALGMDGGGYTPASAEDTWQRRFGDCKGKTSLLIALLDELGIEAVPVLVSSVAGDALPDMLPRLAVFDHVLVKARIDGIDHWLDGTRPDDRRLSDLRHAPYRHALPIVGSGGRLIAVPGWQPERPVAAFRLDLDARAGLDTPARAEGEARFEGEAGVAWRVALRQMAPADRDRAIREFWRGRHDFLEIERVSADEDGETGAHVLRMQGAARMDWGSSQRRRYEADGSVVGFRFDSSREPSVLPDAPFAVDHPYWWEARQTILLPNGGRGFWLSGGNVDAKVGPWRLRRQVALNGERFTLESSVRSMAPEATPSAIRDAEPELRRLRTAAVWIEAPRTPAAPAAANQPSAAASAFMVEADALLQNGDLEAALRLARRRVREAGADHDLMAAAAALIGAEDEDEAAAILARVLASKPDHVPALAATAHLEAARGNYLAAEEQAGRAIAAAERLGRADGRLFLHRAHLRTLLARTEEARADLAMAETMARADADLAALFAEAIADLQQRIAKAEASASSFRAAAEALEEVREPPAWLLHVRAREAVRAGALDEAAQLYDNALAVAPDAALHLERAQLFAPRDRDNWEAHLAAAARLDTGRQLSDAIGKARARLLAAARDRRR